MPIHPTYVVVDEWQRIYATTPEEIHTCYQSTDPQAVAQDNIAFHNAVKRAVNNPNLKFICFASYGTDKIGALLGSPVVFPQKTSEFAYFTYEEITELLDDFKGRTRFVLRAYLICYDFSSVMP
jgi:hypothetical protein